MTYIPLNAVYILNRTFHIFSAGPNRRPHSPSQWPALNLCSYVSVSLRKFHLVLVNLRLRFCHNITSALRYNVSDTVVVDADVELWCCHDLDVLPFNLRNYKMPIPVQWISYELSAFGVLRRATSDDRSTKNPWPLVIIRPTYLEKSNFFAARCGGRRLSICWTLHFVGRGHVPCRLAITGCCHGT